MRRSERSHEAILAACAELLEDVGYAQVSIDGIAARAGVGKQTIYRWWPSKAAVVMEAHLKHAGMPPPAYDTGDIGEDLCKSMKAVVRYWLSVGAGDAMSGIIAEAQTNAETAAAFRREFITNQRAVVRDVLLRGIERGELRADINVDVILDALYGPLVYRLLIAHGTLDNKFAKSVVHALYDGIRA